MRFAILLALAGCASSDPCAGGGSTCVTLTVGGSAVVDRLIVMLSGAAEGAQQTPQSGAVTLPQVVGLDIASVSDGTLHVQVVAEFGGQLVGRGTTSLPIVTGQRVPLSVDVGPASEGFDGGQSMLDSAAPPVDGGAPPVDAASPDGATAAAPCGALGGLVAYFPLDGDLADHSGAGYGLVAANVRPTAGKLGLGLVFNGAISIARVVGTPLGLGERTLCAWIESAPRVSAGEPLFAGGQGDVGELYGVQASFPQGHDCTSAGALFADPGTGCVTGGPIAPAATFAFVCFVESAATRQSGFYSNGSLSTLAIAQTPFDLTTLTIGAKPDTVASFVATAPAFDGIVDEISIWNRALSRAELDSLWQGGVGCKLR